MNVWMFLIVSITFVGLSVQGCSSKIEKELVYIDRPIEVVKAVYTPCPIEKPKCAIPSKETYTEVVDELYLCYRRMEEAFLKCKE